jgi:hypothetical protein
MRRDNETRFKPGQSGNPRGRPKGARSRLSERVLADLSEDYSTNGIQALRQSRENDPVAYIPLIASLLPKQAETFPNPLADLTDAELDKLDAFLATIQGEDGSPSGPDETNSPVGENRLAQGAQPYPPQLALH